MADLKLKSKLPDLMQAKGISVEMSFFPHLYIQP